MYSDPARSLSRYGITQDWVERRISNFLLWQISYAEIHVSDVCWPEFGKEQLHAAFRDYGRRVRKFGKVL